MDELPEGAIETHRVTVVAYLNPDGSNAYMVHAKGDAPSTSYLGLLFKAQMEVNQWGME